MATKMSAKLNAKKEKRDSKQIDKLIAEVDRLHTQEDYSVNRACQEVGIQPTVYYFRKRRDSTLAKPHHSNGNGNGNGHVTTIPAYDSKNLDVKSLKEEARQLEQRLQSIKNRIADAVLAE
jgi:transposase-like protein